MIKEPNHIKCHFLASVFMKDKQALAIYTLWLLSIPGWPGLGLGPCCGGHRVDTVVNHKDMEVWMPSEI